MSGTTYRAMSRIRHLFGIHNRASFSISPRCDWCGHRSAKQTAIAIANAKAFEQRVESEPNRAAANAAPNGDPA